MIGLIAIYFIFGTLFIAGILGIIYTYKEYKEDTERLKRLNDESSSDDL